MKSKGSPMHIMISGPQGCGKSTLKQLVGLFLIQQGYRVNTEERGTPRRLAGSVIIEERQT